MKFEIKHRFTGNIISSVDTTSWKLAIEAAIKNDVDLRGSDLSGSNLSGSDLRNSDLSGSDLRNSDLRGCNLSGSDLRNSDLRDSDLRGSNLRNCNLRNCNLSGSDLSDSDLRNSDLRGSNLTPIRDDLWAVLSGAPAEVAGLRQALIDGKVNGSTYTGECACLVGTIANVRHANYTTLEFIKPNSNRPIERFFFGISEGNTPENNQFSKLAVEWIDQWLTNMRAAFGIEEKSDE